MKNNKVFIFLASIVMCTVAMFSYNKPEKIEAAQSLPRVIVSSYNVSSDGITAGSTFDLTYTLKNTSATNEVTSVLVTCTSNSETIYPVYTTSDQMYIEQMAPGEEIPVTVKFNSASEIDVASIDLTMNISYYDDLVGQGVNQTVLQIPVKQDSVLVIQSYSIPINAITGTKARVNATLENTGIDELYNVKMTITGDGMDNVVSDIGTMGANSKKQQEAYIEFNEAGTHNVTITYTYEDSKGQQFEVVTEPSAVEVTKSQLQSTEQNNNVVNNSANGIEMWQIVVIAAIIIVGVFIIVIVKKQKR